MTPVGHSRPQAIAHKQRERRELRKLAQEGQRRLDEKALLEEELMNERARMRQAEQRTILQIESAKAESKARHEKAASRPWATH